MIEGFQRYPVYIANEAIVVILSILNVLYVVEVKSGCVL
jgi:hypothetical protein